MQNLEDNIKVNGSFVESEDGIGIYLAEIGKYSILTPEAQRQLAYKIRKGDKLAVEKMINHNLRLVVAIAKRFRGRGLSLQDMIQEGNQGLIASVSRFDPNMPNKFSTYASSYIKGYIKTALQNNASLIRILVWTKHTIPCWEETTDDLKKELRYEPSPQEVARRLNIPKKTILYIQKALQAKYGSFNYARLDKDLYKDEGI